MARSSRMPRTTKELVEALDHHQLLLRDHFHGLKTDPAAHLKIVAGELRALVCESSGTEGLIWRLIDSLGVSDEILIQGGGILNPDANLARGMDLAYFPIRRHGDGPPNFETDVQNLRTIIKMYEAIHVRQFGGVQLVSSVKTDDKGKNRATKERKQTLTHEELIKCIAQQMGIAHESEGMDPWLDQLNTFLVNGLPLFVSILALDAELTLQVGERILDHAEAKMGYRRFPRPPGRGDVSVVVRFSLSDYLAGRVRLVTLRSEISELEVECEAGPASAVFTIWKRGVKACEILAAYPDNRERNTDAVFILSYSSSNRKARVITNGNPSKPLACDAGWLDVREFRPPNLADSPELVNLHWVMHYERLLASDEGKKLASLSRDAREIRLSEPPPPGPFPD